MRLHGLAEPKCGDRMGKFVNEHRKAQEHREAEGNDQRPVSEVGQLPLDEGVEEPGDQRGTNEPRVGQEHRDAERATQRQTTS